jgi:hypothetical protein
MGNEDSKVTGRRKNRGVEASPGNAPVQNRSRISPEQEQTWRTKMLLELHAENAAPDFIYAFEETGNYILPDCRDEWNKAELAEWDGLRKAYARRFALEERILDLCFRLPRTLQRSVLGAQKGIAASEFGFAASTAHEVGISSFVVEQIFREVWLDAALRQSRPPDREWDPTDHHRFDHIDLDPIRDLLNSLSESNADASGRDELGLEVRKRADKIAAARATKDIWFGKPTAPGHDIEAELVFVLDEVHHAVQNAEEEDVPQDVIESMLLRSWIRFLFLNEQRDERAFHLLDRSWDEVHARFQLAMAQSSHLRVQ